MLHFDGMFKVMKRERTGGGMNMRLRADYRTPTSENSVF